MADTAYFHCDGFTSDEEDWHSVFDPISPDELAWLDRVAILLGIEDPEPPVGSSGKLDNTPASSEQ